MKNRPIIGGNWKMHKTIAEGNSFIEGFLNKIDGLDEVVDIVIIPPFTSIHVVSRALEGRKIHTGGQNMHFEEKGAFTGEISASMLLDAGATYVVLGHSERRTLFKETSDLVSKKVKMAVNAGLKPILCIGETKEERMAGKTETILKEQLTGSLNGIGKERMASIVIAYEPVWAIGTGLTATPQQAQEAHLYVRDLLANIYDEGVARTTRIQYGGSIKPDNAKALFSQPDIDGGLVGGASLDPGSLVDIIKGAIG